MVDSLPNVDQQRIEQLNSLLRKDLDLLYEINRKQVVETRPLESEQLRQQAEQIRQFYTSHRKEYADLLRLEIPARFAPGEQALIHMIVQRLNFDQLALTRTALQEADRHPDAPEFVQLSAEVVAALSSVQQQLAAKDTPAAHHIAQVTQVIQAPTADIKQKLKLSIPLIPLFLAYETEFNLNIAANLKVAWERLKVRFHPS